MRRGFTLVELCVVVAILALLVAVTAVSVRQPLVQAQRGKVIEQVRFMDALARRRCGDSFAPYSMRLKPESGLIWLVDRKGSKLAGAVGLPSGLKLLRVIGAKKDQSGVYEIRIDEFGTSSSYACKIGKQEGASEWLVVLGLTGQTYKVDSAKNAMELVSPRVVGVR